MSTLSHGCVLYGDDGLMFCCQAEDREHAVEQCANAYPDENVHVAVPADNHGGMTIQTFAEDPVSCPKCGSRTEFGEFKFSNSELQIHVCLCCNLIFLAQQENEEEDEVLT